MSGHENRPELKGVSEAAMLVAYADGAIVSRVLTKGPSGSLTLFAFDLGQEISEHTTPHEAFALGLDGTLEIAVGGVAHSLAKDELLRLPAEVPHALRALTRAKMLLVMFKS